MNSGYRVLDAMTRRPITASEDETLHSIANLMLKKKIGSVLLKHGDKLVGIVTEYDLVRRAMVNALDVKKTKVSKVMTSADEMIVISSNMDIFKAVRLMRENDVRHLPVLDGGKLVGFLTVKDVLRIQPELFELLVEKYEIREASSKPVREAKTGQCSICKNYSDHLIEIRGVVVCPDCVPDVE